MSRLARLTVLAFAPFCFGFQSPNAPKIVPAQLIHEVKPAYPVGARTFGIQGTVLLRVVVNDQGVPEQIEIISPLGYGLDEAAVDAIRQWRYRPTTLNGKPAAMVTEITVDFNLPRSPFDRKLEAQRTFYNVALAAIEKGPAAGAVASLKSLCSQKYPPALYLYGTLLEQGRGVPADADEGFRLIQESAGEQFGPAMYQVAIARLQGRRLEKDPAAGMQLMQGAAQSGSIPAQAFMGQAYEKGDGVPMDLQKSRENYRLCAASGDGLCQYHLGELLLNDPEHAKRDYIQAIAWLQLSAERGVEQARQALQQENSRLTADQISGARKLMTQLVHKPQ